MIYLIKLLWGVNKMMSVWLISSFCLSRIHSLPTLLYSSLYGFLCGLHQWSLLPFYFQLGQVHGKHANCWRAGQEWAQGICLPGFLPARTLYVGSVLLLKFTAFMRGPSFQSTLQSSGNQNLPLPLHTLWGFLKPCSCLWNSPFIRLSSNFLFRVSPLSWQGLDQYTVCNSMMPSSINVN